MEAQDLKKLELKQKIKITFDTSTVENISKCSYKLLEDNIIQIKSGSNLLKETQNKLAELMHEVYGKQNSVIFIEQSDSNNIWLKVRQDIRENTQHGEQIDRAWFEDIEVIEDQKTKSITIKTKTAFRNDYLKQYYAITLNNYFQYYGFTLDRYEHKNLKFIKAS